MKKKIGLLLLAAALVSASSIVGCGADNKKNSADNAAQSDDAGADDDVVIESDGLLAEVSQDDLLKKSSLIVYGEIKEVTDFNKTEEDGIYCDCYIVPEKVYRGDYEGQTQGLEIQIRAFGGTYGNEIEFEDTRAKFEEGEKCLVFLEEPTAMYTDGAEYYTVNGECQGVYYIKDKENIPDDISELVLQNMQEGSSETFCLGEMEKELETINKEYPAEECYYNAHEEIKAALKNNADIGLITQEYLEQNLKEEDEFIAAKKNKVNK